MVKGDTVSLGYVVPLWVETAINLNFKIILSIMNICWRQHFVLEVATKPIVDC